MKTSNTTTNQRLPSLDVIVPCYNEARDIIPCVDALLAQQDDINQIILIDNASTDGTLDLMKQLMKKANHKKIIVIEEKERGLIAARNTGFAAANADIFARIDGDTRVEPGWALAIRHYYAVHSTIGFAIGTSTHYDMPESPFFAWVNHLFTYTANEVLAHSTLAYGANMSITRAAWQRASKDFCNRTGIMEDQDVQYHIRTHGYETGYIDDAHAVVSGRRARTSPLKFWRYNRQWWYTYAIHGQMGAARRIRVAAWVGNILQLLGWFVLQFHDPDTNRFSLLYVMRRQEDRPIT